MSYTQMATGTYEADTAAEVISCGFKPMFVSVRHIDGTAVKLEWDNSMPDASGMKTILAAAYISTNGITPYAGSDTPGSEAAAGFTIGADADVQATGETVHWFAIGHG